MRPSVCAEEQPGFREPIESARLHGLVTAEKAGDRQWMYTTALRSLAQIRHKERAVATPADPVQWNETWRPSPEQQQELNEELRLVARRLAMMENFEAFVRECRDGIADARLRDYQIAPFEATQTFVSGATQDLILSDEPLIQNLTKAGYLNEPPSFGKTYFMAAIARAVGTGKPPNERDPYPIRTLLLTPRRKLVRQTIGKPTITTKAERGFAKVAPELAVTPYYSAKQDLSGDVVVMTYQSFINAVRNGTLDEHHFDLILCDEAHRILAPKTLEALNQYRAGRLTIGLTGSPQYDEGKKVSDVLPTFIDGSDPLTGIHEGYINGFQYWAYKTESEIIVKNQNSTEFSDAEVYPLIHDEARNRLILSIAKRDIENGLRGIIRCVRGGDCLHPRIISELSSTIKIRDPITGKMRPMNIVAVDYKQDDILDELIDMLSEPNGPDALAYIGVLNEGVDSDAIRFIVDGAPTMSEVVSKQVAGRSYRIDPHGRLSSLSQLFDQVVGRKRQYTFLHAFGLQEFEQGIIVASAHTPTGPATSDPGGLFNGGSMIPQDFPAELQGSLIEDLAKYCAEELEMKPIYSELPPGAISLTALVERGRQYVPALARTTVRNMLKRQGFEDPLYAKPDDMPPGFYYQQGAWETLESILRAIEFPPEGWRPRNSIIRELGIASYRFDTFVKDSKIEGRVFNHPQNLVESLYFPPEAMNFFNDFEGARPSADPTDIEVLKLSREVGATPLIMERFLRMRGIRPQEKRVPSGHPARFLDARQAAEVRNYFGVVEGSLTISEIAYVLGIPRARVHGWLQKKGLAEANKEELKQSGSAPRLNNYGRRFEPFIVAEAIDALTPDVIEEDWMTLREYVESRGHSYSQAKRLIEANNIPVRYARGAGARTASHIIYLDAEGRARFDAVAPAVQNALPGERTMAQLKEMTGFSDFKIRSALTPEQLAGAVPKNTIHGTNIGRRAPHFPAETVVALLKRFQLPVPPDVADAVGKRNERVTLKPGKTASTKAKPPAKLAPPTPAQTPEPTPGYIRRLADHPGMPANEYTKEPWVRVGELLKSIKCDSKSFWTLLRRLSMASPAIFRREEKSQEVMMQPYAAAKVVQAAKNIVQAPSSWYTPSQIGSYCGVSEERVHEFMRTIVPNDGELQLFRSHDSGYIALHVAPRIAAAAKRRFKHK